MVCTLESVGHGGVYCHLQITLELCYMFFFACIFVELFLNNKCIYLDDF